MKPRSKDVTEGFERAPARSMLRAVGMKDEDFKKPQIGIASSWNEITPCNMSLRRLAEKAKAGVFAAPDYVSQIMAIAKAGYSESSTYAAVVTSIANKVR
jgi:dihydroxy-acid dehydratase